MLKTIQIVALLQGLFLLVALFKNKNKYLKPAFWLLVGCIISVIFYIVGDDDNNLFLENLDLFYFDKSLFITFLFLFIKYQLSDLKHFSKKDLIFFIPNIVYVIIEVSEIFITQEMLFIELLELATELTFLAYLLYTIYTLIKNRSQKWMLLFLVPLVTLMSISIINEVLVWFGFREILLATDQYFGSYMLIIVAFLFYSIALKLIISPKKVLPNFETEKYKNSSLNQEQITKYKKALIVLMEKEEAYRDATLSILKVADKLKIPRQYISEVVNVHMQTNFQDFVNSYRVEAFIQGLNNVQYNHFTLLGIAKEVGFNSKSTFNSTFKKIKGLTPSDYKKRMS